MRHFSEKFKMAKKAFSMVLKLFFYIFFFKISYFEMKLDLRHCFKVLLWPDLFQIFDDFREILFQVNKPDYGL